MVWELRQSLTGSVTEAIIGQRHQPAQAPSPARCPQCARVVKTRGVVHRTLETLVGSVEVWRPYFYCDTCGWGLYPFDDACALAPGHKQYDLQQAAATLGAEVP